MADEDENPDAEESKKGGGMMGPILGVLVVATLAVVLMVMLGGMFGGEEPDPDEAEQGVLPQEERGSLLEGHVAIALDDILSNVRGQDLRRYVKVSMQFWIKAEDQPSVDREEVKRRLRGALEERLHSYSMEDLDNDSIHTRIKRGFRETIDQVLRETTAERDPERAFVVALDLQGLLVQ